MNAFRKGEIVNVTIRGARIHDISDRLHLLIGNGTPVTVDHTSDGVTVERVSPPGWPPELADVWLDCDGAAWFCARLGPDRGDMYLYSADGNDQYIEQVAASYGPLTLAYRLGADVKP